MEYFTNIKKVLEDPAGFSLSRLNAEAESIQLKDKKPVIDVALRSRMLHLLSSDSVDEVKVLLKICVAAALANICSAQTPFVLFADVFNTKPISVCHELFTFMEETITTLKDVPLFDSGRNMLLRMCNDLLRRLSKSQNTEFCGRIQLFLSRLFPLDEKSGLNLMSNFNVDKETPYNKNPEASLFRRRPTSSGTTEAMEEGELKRKSSHIDVDANLYVKFWSIQDFFKIPTQCFDKSKWPLFQNCTETILDVFSSIKLKVGPESSVSNANKFSKYLTSEKLLDLQLMDPSFRRYILVQLLLVFQYLTLPNKFKTVEQILREEQAEWVSRKRETVLHLLSDGKKSKRSQPSSTSDSFVSVVERILEREAYWNRWKNEGCPSFIRSAEKALTEPRKRRVNALVDRAGNKIFRFGNPILDKLWNTCPDHLAACRDEKRLFRRTMQEYFEDAILEMDPAEKVEEEYKSINREEWCWRALRFLSRRSSHFYVNWNPPGRPVKDYLTVILKEKIHLDEEKKTATSDSLTASTCDFESERTEPSPAKVPRLAEGASGDPAPVKLRRHRPTTSSEISSKVPKKSHPTDKVIHSTTKEPTASTHIKEEAMINEDEFSVKSEPDAELLADAKFRPL